MREQVRTQSYTSSPYPYIPEYAGVQDASRGNPHHSMTTSAPVDAFDPWVLEGPPCGSPLSTASSIGHSECVPTPPYDSVAMYEPHFQDISDPSVGHTPWKSEPEQLWRPNYAEPNAWCSPSYVLPYHTNPAQDQLPVQPMHSYMPLPRNSAYDSYVAHADGFATPYEPTVTGRADSMPFKFRGADFKAEPASNRECDNQSDSDSDDSDNDDSASQKSSASTAKDTRAARNVMNLGKWANNVIDLYNNTTQQRLYECPMHAPGQSKAVPCERSFIRPEHLRRHVKTVHSKERLYMCKVPDCQRPFSRGDNLREHYWTHVERGGRGGKNRKMGLLELKAILGPKEKQLTKRLKRKLDIQTQKILMCARPKL
ncbi:hypothetical protein P3342_006243 [Pyrenophora teres f. teres]|uniref:C2H2-type domain-containing protein n=1 Tax=Pyrenophora teres f. teres TaxID=97479 RepID=A0A6S6VZ84_9PLEO|nr:hypothetical protein HRS9139_04867 [Pyrenophora teres f. teres]KAE8841183.1 hypothetical protein PTNB85_04582 [Pyrenophora teres f. teres]KAE8848680.1 hypothetical protein HRS9122_02696 [Pyrenophora teres f. teres]KAE8864679.1 hypothetical protein PTNB29_04643 [Pyrenophora teres f. teres]KAE8867467.1 hypothetical protein PTNB73_05561 [Pyrenophora teres f. teres]